MRGWLALAAGLLLGSAAFARAPDASPFPRPRPDGPAAVAPMSISNAAVIEALRTMAPPPRPAVETAPSAELPAPETLATAILREAPGASPLPRRRPAGLRAPVPAAPVTPARATARAEAPAPSADDERGLCGVRGLTGQRLPRIAPTAQGCGIDEPVRISAVQGITLSPAATLNCDTARAFDRWVREAMQPALGNRGGGVDRMIIGSHYACRTRNSQRGARLSEHARGSAIDVMGFVLEDGERIDVEGNFRSGRHRRALNRMYDDACGIFRTTLGPDADRFHYNHFHFDLARHRNGGTYCR